MTEKVSCAAGRRGGNAARSCRFLKRNVVPRLQHKRVSAVLGTRRARKGEQRRRRFVFIPCTVQGNGQRGPFSHVREWPPLDPPRERKGLCPLTPPLQASSSKSCEACGIRCGVHGFAMNPYVSLRLATAPYYREARVTFPWRQTACGMRHCWRSPHCGDWR